MDTVTADLESVSLNKDIASDDDVILEIGSEKPKLKVYSQCLRSASTNFRDMLKVGKELSGNNLPIVQLPDDEAEAFELVCSILHHRNEQAPAALTAEKILNVAVIAEKYQLSLVLRYATMNWMDPRKTWSIQDTLYIMTAAYAIDDYHVSAAGSLEVLLNHGEVTWI